MVTDLQIRRLRRLDHQGLTKGQAAAKAGLDDKTARKYRRLGRLPSEVRMEHSWRTRPNPFAEVWARVEEQLTLNPGLEAKTVFDWLHQWDPSAVTEEIRGLLGQMLFPRDDANKKTEVLSGGEAARLLFCKLMLQKPSVLVLDEPTNHLDLESINALNIALQRYQGTVLLVSHDHDLIDEVATRIWHFESDHRITDFKGVYEEFVAVSA